MAMKGLSGWMALACRLGSRLHRKSCGAAISQAATARLTGCHMQHAAALHAASRAQSPTMSMTPSRRSLVTSI